MWYRAFVCLNSCKESFPIPIPHPTSPLITQFASFPPIHFPSTPFHSFIPPHSFIPTNTPIRTEQKSKPLSRNVIIHLQVPHPHKRNHHSKAITLQPRLQHILHLANPIPPILGIPNIPPIPENLPSNSHLPIPAERTRKTHRYAHRRAALASQQIATLTTAIYISSTIPRFHLPEGSGDPPRLAHTRGYSARLPLTPVSPFLPKKTRS